MGNHFSTATLDDATIAIIKRKTRMKSSEITNWYNELKVRINDYFYLYKNQQEENILDINLYDSRIEFPISFLVDL
jgi:hypothetical protein